MRAGIDESQPWWQKCTMQLLRMRLNRQGPFEVIELDFGEDGEPRPVTVIQGSGGVGKTTLLMALANTRPGNAVVYNGLSREREESGFTVCEFLLGQDDPERPHALTIATPNARVYAEEEREILRRREQAIFDRVARESGFAFVAFPATRWFSRQPIAIVGSGRGLARYDVRSPIPLEDPTRGDLARDTKQALAYAAITRALGAKDPAAERFGRLAEAMQHAVDVLLELLGLRWVGVDPMTLEPIFCGPGKRSLTFDSLATRARHLVAFAALSVRAIWAACPTRHPLEAEGIVVIDEVDLHQDPQVLSRLVPAFKRALPKVQWILTATSTRVASSCELGEVIALRQNADDESVEIYTDALAQTH